jgi:hypothetical protein
MKALRPITRAAARHLNLSAYTRAEFQAWHGPGAGVVTASGIPALLGASRWDSRYSYLRRIADRDAPSKPVTAAMIRGRMLESIAAEMIAIQREDLVVMAGNVVAHHPTIPRFLATPDVVVSRRTAKSPAARYGVGEIKTVGKRTFEAQWADGPPPAVEWQHHAQMAATGARWGIIVALMIAEYPPAGELPFELVIYERERNDLLVEEIEDTVREALAAVDSGDFGSPDPSPHTTKLLRATYNIDPDEIASLQENTEAAKMFDAWEAARRAAAEAKETQDAARDYFTALAPRARLLLLPEGRVIEAKQVKVKSYTVPEQTQVRWTLRRSTP